MSYRNRIKIVTIVTTSSATMILSLINRKELQLEPEPEPEPKPQFVISAPAPAPGGNLRVGRKIN
jgi:hypothetical protein